MLHQMKLWHGPFTFIKSGQKDVELRLHDEKRQRIHPGDQIEFTDASNKETLLVQVVGKQVYRDFAELYTHYDKLRMGYKPEETADPKDMEEFYPAEEIASYGVVAIEIQVIGK